MGLPFRYHHRNLLRRKLRTALTALGIALVIATAVIMLAYSRGLLYSMRNNGEPNNVMVLSRRATDTAFSSLKKGEFAILSSLVVEDVAWSPEDSPEDFPTDLITPYVNHTFLIRIQGVEGGRYGDRKLGLVKGVDPERVFFMHEKLHIARGRPLSEEDERVAVVGALTWARLGVKKEDLDVGAVLEFNGVSWPVVGVFAASGSSADSEIWVPISELMTILNRTAYTYAIVKAKDKQAMASILQTINRSDRTELRALSEEEYYRGYAESFRTFALIGGVMALVITLGGLMVGMNTMFTAVSGRVREIGMLQVIGFSKRAILASFLLESLLIALLGGALGCALGSLASGMPFKVTMGVFVLRVDAEVLAAGMGLAALIGLVGAFLPARRALKLRMVDAMRSM